jgi:hypothetical protein
MDIFDPFVHIFFSGGLELSGPEISFLIDRFDTEGYLYRAFDTFFREGKTTPIREISYRTSIFIIDRYATSSRKAWLRCSLYLRERWSIDRGSVYILYE